MLSHNRKRSPTSEALGALEALDDNNIHTNVHSPVHRILLNKLTREDNWSEKVLKLTFTIQLKSYNKENMSN